MVKKRIENIKRKKKIVKTHVDRKLLARLIFFCVIIFVMLCIVAYDVIVGKMGIPLALAGMIAGLGIGWVAGRIFKMYWCSEANKVVYHLDTIGIIILIFYVTIEVGKQWVFRQWFEGEQLFAFSLIFLSGLLIGRMLSMVRKIKKVLISERESWEIE
ncbi:hypothetical protein ACFL08_04990 [Patescibacteria group bacterium]